MGISPAIIAAKVLVAPRTQIGCWSFILCAKSIVFSNPQAGTSSAISVGRTSAANFFPLNSGLTRSSHLLGTWSGGTRFLLYATTENRLENDTIFLLTQSINTGE